MAPTVEKSQAPRTAARGRLARRSFRSGGLFESASLLALLFLCGAAVLTLEVAAPRILAPYYGNTLHSLSSVLAVILGALSLGYYAGGRLADRHPWAVWFHGLVLASGLCVLLLQGLVRMLLPVLGYSLSSATGPLVCSLLLFFAPGLLLGMLSPYAIRLQVAFCPGQGIGRISGNVFVASTLGSIFGSLLGGFVLIPRFALSTIVLSVGLFLLCLGLAGMGLSAAGRRAQGVP